jgi:hypothetical protein
MFHVYTCFPIKNVKFLEKRGTYTLALSYLPTKVYQNHEKIVSETIWKVNELYFLLHESLNFIPSLPVDGLFYVLQNYNNKILSIISDNEFHYNKILEYSSRNDP